MSKYEVSPLRQGSAIYTTGADDNGLFGAGASRFGTWHNALQAAGIDARIRESWSQEKVIEQLRHHVNSSPGQNIRQIDSNLVYAATRRFGSLSKALEVAGVALKERKPM